MENKEKYKNLKNEKLYGLWFYFVIGLFISILFILAAYLTDTFALGGGNFSRRFGEFIDIGDCFYAQVSSTFLVLSIFSLLTEKSDKVYWDDMIHRRIVEPPFRNFVACTAYLLVLLLCSGFLFLRASNYIAVPFCLSIVILVCFTITIVEAYNGRKRMKKIMGDEYRCGISKGDFEAYEEHNDKMVMASLQELEDHEFDLVAENIALMCETKMSKRYIDFVIGQVFARNELYCAIKIYKTLGSSVYFGESELERVKGETLWWILQNTDDKGSEFILQDLSNKFHDERETDYIYGRTELLCRISEYRDIFIVNLFKGDIDVATKVLNELRCAIFFDPKTKEFKPIKVCEDMDPSNENGFEEVKNGAADVVREVFDVSNENGDGNNQISKAYSEYCKKMFEKGLIPGKSWKTAAFIEDYARLILMSSLSVNWWAEYEGRLSQYIKIMKDGTHDFSGVSFYYYNATAEVQDSLDKEKAEIIQSCISELMNEFIKNDKEGYVMKYWEKESMHIGDNEES